MQQQMEDLARDREAAKRLGIDRSARQASSAPTPSARTRRPGRGGCRWQFAVPACGHVDPGAAPELAGPEGSNLSDREGGEGRTFKDDLDNGGADKRRGQEYQDEQNIAYYVIDPREVPGATERQRWWANNRMNQAMIWADLLREDHEDPNGFAMPPDEVKEIKNLLAGCASPSRSARPTTSSRRDVDEGADTDAGSALKLGSPVLWTILRARDDRAAARGPKCAGRFQAIATLEGMRVSGAGSRAARPGDTWKS